MRVEIECINKESRYSAHEVIKRVGGPDLAGIRWSLPLAEASAGAE